MTIGADIISPLIDGASAVSFGAWVNIDTFTGSDAFESYIWIVGLDPDGRVSVFLGFDTSGADDLVKVGGRSVTPEGFESLAGATDVSTGADHHVGGVLDFGNDTIRVYLDGAQDNSGSVTFDNATYTQGSASTVLDRNGGSEQDPGPAAIAEQLDGRLAEPFMYNIDIGTAGFASLAARFAPPLVLPGNLVWYRPLVRELNGGFGPTNPTVTGSVPVADHQAILYPAPPLWTPAVAAAVAAGPIVGSLRQLGVGR